MDIILDYLCTYSELLATYLSLTRISLKNCTEITRHVGVIFIIFFYFQHLDNKTGEMKTLDETVAYIIDCDMSERKYRKTRKLANPKGNTKRFHLYETAQKHRDEKCMPDAIKIPSDDCIFVDLRDLLHHQAPRLLTSALQTRMLSLKDSRNAKFILYFEYG